MPTTTPSDRPSDRPSAAPAAPTALPCPDCGRPLPGPVAACPSCRLPLRGPLAARLWEVDQRRAALEAERTDLLRRLRTPAGAPPAGRVPAPRLSPELPAGRAAQRLLLTLGAGLLLVAAVVFLAVSWSLLGVGGRVTVMAVLTLACFLGAARLARRGLLSAANSVAALGAALAAADLAAAHALGLAGLDALDPRTWTAVAAGGLATVLLLGVRAALPRLGAVPVAGVLATTVAGAAALSLDEATRVDGALWPWGALALAAVLTGLARGLHRSTTARVLAGVLAALVAAVAGVVAVAVLALGEGTATGAVPTLLAAASVVALVAGTTWRWRATAGTPGAPWGEAVGLGGAVVGAATVVTLADRAGGTALAATAVAAAVVAGVAAGGVARRPLPPPLGAALVAGALPSAVLAVAALPRHPDLAVTSAVALAALALAAGAWALLRPVTGAVTEPLAAALGAGAVAGAAHQHRDGLAAALLLAALAVTGTAAARRGRAAEPGLGAVATATALAAVTSAAEHGEARLLAAVLAAVGLAGFAYALLPRRGWVSLAGVAGASAATWVLLSEARVEVLEAYTLPLAGLLLLVGLERLRRDPAATSWVTVGPAASAALLPSAVLAADEGTWPRAGVVLVTAAAVLLAGVAARRQAPVVTGALALAVTGVAQLAPLAVGLPRWLTLGTVGVVLLLAGVRYEARRAELARARAWVSGLG